MSATSTEIVMPCLVSKSEPVLREHIILKRGKMNLRKQPQNCDGTVIAAVILSEKGLSWYHPTVFTESGTPDLSKVVRHKSWPTETGGNRMP